MGKHSGKLVAYCKAHNLTFQKISDASGVSMSEIKKLNLNPMHNISMDVVERLFLATEKFPQPLTPDVYLDYKVLQQK